MFRLLKVPIVVLVGYIIYILGTFLLDRLITGTSVSDLVMIRVVPIAIASGIVIGALWQAMKPPQQGGGQ